MEIRNVRNMARVAFFMVPFVYEGEVGWGQRGGGGGVGRESDLSLNAVLFVPKWSGLSSPFLTSFGKLGVDFIFIWRFHTNMTNSERSSSESDSLH